MITNPEIDQDRVFDTVDHFNKFGYVMFPEQVQIYRNIAEYIAGKEVIEAGCGNGLGTAILQQKTGYILGTDKLDNNIKFAKCLYPWILFHQWDINEPWDSNEPSILPKSQVCVCIEAIEHVANPQQAIKNLIDAATEEVWISTPNGRGKKRPPDNPYHVQEYTPQEMIKMIHSYPGKAAIQILHWKTFEVVDINTKVNPLVYRIEL